MKKLLSFLLAVLVSVCFMIPCFANETEQEPFIAETVYPTEDVVVADIDITKAPYNADSTGAGDCTEVLNRAINDLYMQGGGTIWMPAGLYTVLGSVKILPFVTIRGDWADPDVYDGEYGTVIMTNASGIDVANPALFTVGGSSAVIGLTVWYMNQNIENPIPCPYTFYVEGNNENYMSHSILNCTLINSYRGIGINTESMSGIYQVHELTTVKNLRATCLYEGISSFNCADVDIYEGVKLSPEYWTEFKDTIDAPTEEELSSYMRQNLTGMVLADLEWPHFSDIHISDCNYAIRFTKGPRYEFTGCFYDLYIEDCNYGLYAPRDTIQQCGDGWGISIAHGFIKASEEAVHIEDNTQIIFADVEIDGKVKAENKRISKHIDLSEYEIDYKRTYQKPDSNLKVVEADKSGLTDISEVLQRTLDSFDGASGVCYLPAGFYRLDKPITVPAGVELRGAGDSTRGQGGLSKGTEIVSYYGYNETDDALITLGGDNAGINAIRIVYALNNMNPDGINGKYNATTPAIKSSCDGIYVVKSCIVLASVGLDLDGCDDFYLDKVLGCAYDNMFRITNCSDGVIKNCHQNATYAVRHGYNSLTIPELQGWLPENMIFTHIFDPILRKQTTYIHLEDSAEIMIYNTFIYGTNTFLETENSQSVIINTGSDGQSNQGFMFVFKGDGDTTVINAMRSIQDSRKGWKASYWSDGRGTVRLYNRTTVNIKYLEPNITENADDSLIERIRNFWGFLVTRVGNFITMIDEL